MTEETSQSFVELILLAPYLDSHLSMTEDEIIEKALAAIGIDASKAGAVNLGTAFAAAREAASCELKTDEFIQSRAAVLKAAGESSIAFEWLGRILGSDGVTGEESRFLKRARTLLFD
jgi:aconitase B